MAVRRILGFNIFALALILVCLVSYNSSERLDNDARLVNVLSGSLRNGKDLNAVISDDEVAREKRGIRLPIKPLHGVRVFTAPATHNIAIPGLVQLKSRSSVQGGGARRARWRDSKNRVIYEWDSRHGELEGYRTSDKKHIGAFDPNTGSKIKEAVAGRKLRD